MNDIRKTIGWADYSWNPIKGLCPVGCWYCYARAMYKRFGWSPHVTYEPPDFELYGKIKSGSRIFVCSTFDLFHAAADQFRDNIFQAIATRPDLTFIILTKIPERIDRPMPTNVWLGVSVTNRGFLWRMDALRGKEARVRFVSFEPLLRDFALDVDFTGIDWAIIGRLTGHGHKGDPTIEAVEMLASHAAASNVPVFLKSNLREIVGDPLIQEFPR